MGEGRVRREGEGRRGRDGGEMCGVLMREEEVWLMREEERNRDRQRRRERERQTRLSECCARSQKRRSVGQAAGSQAGGERPRAARARQPGRHTTTAGGGGDGTKHSSLSLKKQARPAKRIDSVSPPSFTLAAVYTPESPPSQSPQPGNATRPQHSPGPFSLTLACNCMGHHQRRGGVYACARKHSLRRGDRHLFPSALCVQLSGHNGNNVHLSLSTCARLKPSSSSSLPAIPNEASSPPCHTHTHVSTQPKSESVTFVFVARY